MLIDTPARGGGGWGVSEKAFAEAMTDGALAIRIAGAVSWLFR
jgi:hypothetical protein